MLGYLPWRCMKHNLGPVTWSGGPRSSGVGFFCFHALGNTKQKKPTSLNRGPPLHVNRVLIADVVMKPRWFLKIVWENFVVNNLRFFYVRIVKGPKTNIFTCKLCAWVIFIILFTKLVCDNSNSLTYEQRKGAKFNTFTCQLCDCTSHADNGFSQ